MLVEELGRVFPYAAEIAALVQELAVLPPRQHYIQRTCDSLYQCQTACYEASTRNRPARCHLRLRRKSRFSTPGSDRSPAPGHYRVCHCGQRSSRSHCYARHPSGVSALHRGRNHARAGDCCCHECLPTARKPALETRAQTERSPHFFAIAKSC